MRHTREVPSVYLLLSDFLAVDTISNAFCPTAIVIAACLYLKIIHGELVMTRILHLRAIDPTKLH